MGYGFMSIELFAARFGELERILGVDLARELRVPIVRMIETFGVDSSKRSTVPPAWFIFSNQYEYNRLLLDLAERFTTRDTWERREMLERLLKEVWLDPNSGYTATRAKYERPRDPHALMDEQEALEREANIFAQLARASTTALQAELVRMW
jgi:hypothetical protein